VAAEIGAPGVTVTPVAAAICACVSTEHPTGTSAADDNDENENRNNTIDALMSPMERMWDLTNEQMT
jgi:hypothetical protein